MRQQHDTMLFYAKDPGDSTIDPKACDRIPSMAPGLIGEEQAARGKSPADVWWRTIVPPTGREKTGYPTQKPLGILRRIITVHTRPGDLARSISSPAAGRPASPPPSLAAASSGATRIPRRSR